MDLVQDKAVHQTLNHCVYSVDKVPRNSYPIVIHIILSAFSTNSSNPR